MNEHIEHPCATCGTSIAIEGQPGATICFRLGYFENGIDYGEELHTLADFCSFACVKRFDLLQTEKNMIKGRQGKHF